MKTGYSYYLEAISKQDFLSRAGSLSDQISDHLIKIASIHDPEAEGHWIAEANAWLRNINHKSLKVKLPAQQLYSILYREIDIPSIKLFAWQNDYMKNKVYAHISIYDKFRDALKHLNPLLDEFAHLPLKSFKGLITLKSFKSFVKDRGTSYTTYLFGEVSKA